MRSRTAWARVRRRLQQMGQTQAWLAVELGVSQSLISLWLSGKRAPTLETAIQIEALTGVPAKTLVDLTEVRELSAHVDHLLKG